MHRRWLCSPMAPNFRLCTPHRRCVIAGPSSSSLYAVPNARAPPITPDAPDWLSNHHARTSSATHSMPSSSAFPSRTNNGAVCDTLAEAHARVQRLWTREMHHRGRAFDQQRRTHRRLSASAHAPTSSSSSSSSRASMASYLALTALSGLHAWWQACETQVWLPADVLHDCEDAPQFVVDLVRQATSAPSTAATTTAIAEEETSRQTAGWRARFQRLSDDALLDEFDEWLLLHAASGTGEGLLSFTRFLSLLESYLRYHQGVTWGVSPHNNSNNKKGHRGTHSTEAASAFDRRRYALHPWDAQDCPEGRPAQMPFVHLLQWMLARDSPSPRLPASGADSAAAEADLGRSLWQRFHALEPFRPPTTTGASPSSSSSASASSPSLSVGTPSMGFAALDVGCQSGFATDLLLTAGARYVLAVDRTEAALHSTESTVHDHMQRAKGSHGRELAAQHQRVQVQQCALLPAPSVDVRVVDATVPDTASPDITDASAATTNAFARAAQRRRQQARAQGTVYADAEGRQRTSTAASSDRAEEADEMAPFDVLYFHPPCLDLWPATTLAERRHGLRLGELWQPPFEWGHADVSSTREARVLPWVLSPTAHAVHWAALPSADPLSATTHARAASSRPADSAVASMAVIHELVEQLTLDVVQRSAGWSSRTSTADPAVMRRERPLVQEDGYVMLVLPRTVDGTDMVRVLHSDVSTGGLGAALPSVSVADGVLAALEGLYEPVLRRAYVPSLSSETGRLPQLVHAALAAIDAPSSGATVPEDDASPSPPLPRRRDQTADTSHTDAAATLLHTAHGLSQTVDVLVLRKNTAACARARAVAASLSAKHPRRASAQETELKQALDMYERLTTRLAQQQQHSHTQPRDAERDEPIKGTGTSSSSSSPLLEWRDSFEHNEYKPRSAPTTRYHWTDLVPSYSYLESDYLDRATESATSGNFLAVGHPPSLQVRLPRDASLATSSTTSADAQATITAAARHDMPRATTRTTPTTERARASPGHRAPEAESAARASEAFRAIFAHELRHQRRGKMRKLALSPIQQQEWYVDTKLLQSGAAKVELMNELSRWDLKDYD